MQTTARQMFDEVMRLPEAERGLNVGKTWQLLDQRVKAIAGPSEYDRLMQEVQSEYLEQFLHTCLVIPDFAEQIRDTAARYL